MQLIRFFQNIRNRCKDGYFGLSADDPVGCIPCFCHGHSSNCTMSTNYLSDVIQSDFTTGEPIIHTNSSAS